MGGLFIKEIGCSEDEEIITPPKNLVRSWKKAEIWVILDILQCYNQVTKTYLKLIRTSRMELFTVDYFSWKNSIVDLLLDSK